MDVEEAARRLAATIKAPKHGVAVVPWLGSPEKILVWYNDRRGARLLSRLPHAFAGFEVKAERQPALVVHRDRIFEGILAFWFNRSSGLSGGKTPASRHTGTTLPRISRETLR